MASRIQALIISYHFLPMDVIASYRALAYAEHLAAHDIWPTIITHRWEEEKTEDTIRWRYHEQGSSVIYEKFQNFETYRLPRLAPNIRYDRKSIIKNWLQGSLDYELKESYQVFKEFLHKHLRKRKYDFILAIFSPHYHLRLAYELKKAFHIPYVLDFRDLWNNSVMQKKYSPSLTDMVKTMVTVYWWKKWLKEADFFLTISYPFLYKMKKYTSTEGYVVHNGYDNSYYTLQTAQRTDNFTICHAGNMYDHQKPDIFFEGLNTFLKQHSPNHFKVKIIGLREQKLHGKHSVDTVMHLLHDISKKYIEFVPRMSKKEVIGEMQNAQVLYFPTFPGTKGIYSGKIFDYLGAKRNVLAVPNDHDVIEELLEITKAGRICDTSEEVALYLHKMYKEWKTEGKCTYNGNDKIQFYSRKYQVKQFSALVKDYFLTGKAENN